MRRKKPIDRSDFVLFDVVYEDGTRSSNRRVPSEVLRDVDGDAAARTFLQAQDNDIATRANRKRAAIKSIARAAVR